MLNFFKSKQATDMWLLAGLGNPGDKYARNRHNIGFMAIDAIASDYNFPAFRGKFQGQLAEGQIGGEKVALLKPQTFMNNSGQALQAAAKFYKIKPDRIVIFYDELDLEPGKIRVKKGGGAAGHNGIRSAQAHLGTPDFWRVRLGIGHPGDKNRVSGYVLSDFAKADQDWLEPLLTALSRHINYIVAGDMESYMSKVAMDAPAPSLQKRKKEN